MTNSSKMRSNRPVVGKAFYHVTQVNMPDTWPKLTPAHGSFVGVNTRCPPHGAHARSRESSAAIWAPERHTSSHASRRTSVSKVGSKHRVPWGLGLRCTQVCNHRKPQIPAYIICTSTNRCFTNLVLQSDLLIPWFEVT